MTPAEHAATVSKCHHEWRLISQTYIGPAPGCEETPFETLSHWYCTRCRALETTTDLEHDGETAP